MLIQERERLDSLIQTVRRSGEIAPAYYFLSQVRVSGARRDYFYMRLIQQQDGATQQKVRSLGRIGSQEHQHWERAIVRRDAIRELEFQLALLDQLIERQVQHQELIERAVQWIDGRELPQE